MAARDRLIREWLAMPTSVHNGRMLTNSFYEYLIDLDVLRGLVEALRSSLSMGQAAYITSEQAQAAYREGMAKAVANLAGLSSGYTRTVSGALADQPAMRRAALVYARVFEAMQGFADDTASDLSRVLFTAVQDGESPRVTARTIRDRFKVAMFRAERIARTEIVGAHRRGRWDEAQDAKEKFGMEVMLVHFSALIPDRTRATHAARHGKIVSIEDQREWYQRDGNAINCLCSSSEVTMDNEGNPMIGPKLRAKLAKQKAAFGG